MTDPTDPTDPTNPPPPPPPPPPSGGFPLPPGAGRPGYQQEPGYLQPGYTAAPGWGPQQYADSDDPMISPDYPGWWRRSMAALRRSWPQLLGLNGAVAVLSIGFQIVFALQFLPLVNELQAAIRANGPGEVPEQALDDFLSGLGGIAVLAGVGGLAVGVLTAIVSLASVRIVVDGANGGPIHLGGALSLAARRFFPLVGWGLLTVPLVLLGVCCFLLPGLYLGALFFTLLVPVVALERGNAIGRVFTLAHKDLGTGLSRIATIFGIALLVGVVSGAINTVVRSGGGDEISTAALIVLAVATGLLSLASQVFLMPLRVLAYADMRARVEPLSAQMLRDAG